jgi:threonine/homoserine/homoserine lactone efflux protein
MDASAALIAGLAAGLAIAVQVGAVSLLLVETAVVAGPRVGIAAGMGVATVDLAFAVVAVAAGSAVGALLSSHESQIRLIAAATLAGIALCGLFALTRGRASGDGEAAHATRAGARRQYVRFVAITSANPLTIASFAAVATSLSLAGPGAAVAFALGVGAASGGWHLVLSVAAGHAGCWITPRVQQALAIGGRVAVLAIAAHLALAA